MRTSLKLAASCLIIAGIAQPVFAQESPTLRKIKDSGTIALGHRESSIPFSYYDDKQQVVGYSQELMLKVVDAVKAELKMPSLAVKLTPVTSQNRIPLVQNGTVDIECGSTTNNAERGRQVAFSNTIFIIGTRLMTKKESGIKDFPDLAGKNVVTTAGTTSERLIRKMNEDKKLAMNIISAKDHGESFLTLETGRAVAFMMDDALIYGEMAKAKRASDWAVVGTPAELRGLRLHDEKGRPGLQEGRRRRPGQGHDLRRGRGHLQEVVHPAHSPQGPEPQLPHLRRHAQALQGAQRQGLRISRSVITDALAAPPNPSSEKTR